MSSDEWRQTMLKGGDSKLLGVEMEAGGVLAAADGKVAKTYMLRVISDKADPSKTDNVWRSRGMKTLAHMLLKLPLGQLLGR